MPGRTDPRLDDPELGPPCPMCGLPLEPHSAVPDLLACYVDGLSWNPRTGVARAVRGTGRTLPVPPQAGASDRGDADDGDDGERHSEFEDAR
jgi:hypothetical protein